MNTHNIHFSGELRKISLLFGERKLLKVGLGTKIMSEYPLYLEE